MSLVLQVLGPNHLPVPSQKLPGLNLPALASSIALPHVHASYHFCWTGAAFATAEQLHPVWPREGISVASGGINSHAAAVVTRHCLSDLNRNQHMAFTWCLRLWVGREGRWAVGPQ